MKTLKTAKDGDIVKFTRHGIELTGEVHQVRESSVVVMLSDEDAEILKLDTPLTIVSHKNYVVI